MSKPKHSDANTAPATSAPSVSPAAPQESQAAAAAEGAATASNTQPNTAGAVPATAGADSAPKVKLVKMVRHDAPEGQPTTADVHPDEVEEWSRFGWVKAKAKAE